MNLPMSQDGQTLLDRTLEIGSALAAHCRVVDPDQSRGWSRLSLQLLERMNAFAASASGQALLAGAPLTGADRTVLQMFSLNMLLLEALCAHAEAQQPPTNALPLDIAETIARFLVDVGSLAETAYKAHEAGVNVDRYLQEAMKASAYLGPLSDAFIAAMQGDDDAATKAQQLLWEFMVAAASGRIMRPPWEIEGEGQP